MGKQRIVRLYEMKSYCMSLWREQGSYTLFCFRTQCRNILYYQAIIIEFCDVKNKPHLKF